MAWNSYFPTGYQPYPMQYPQQPQTASRMVEVVPVDSIQAAESFPVSIGTTLMMIGKDDSFIAVKINGVNGQSSFEIYDKRPPAPPAPQFDPAVYVRKDEIENLVNAVIEARKEHFE